MKSSSWPSITSLNMVIQKEHDGSGGIKGTEQEAGKQDSNFSVFLFYPVHLYSALKSESSKFIKKQYIKNSHYRLKVFKGDECLVLISSASFCKWREAFTGYREQENFLKIHIFPQSYEQRNKGLWSRVL